MSLTTGLWGNVADVPGTMTPITAPSNTDNIRTATTTFIYNIIDIIVSYVINLSVIVFGITTNACNIFIYSNFGLKDSVSVCFLALSASDLCLLIIALVSRVIALLTFVAVRTPVNLFQLGYLFVWYFQMMLDISTFTTTFIAVQRCLSVALPFKVRTLFTRNRTLGCIGCVYFSVCSCYVPIFSKQCMVWRVDPIANISLYVIYYAEGRDNVLAFADVTFRIAFRIFPQMIVIACLVVLVSSLRASVAFRQTSSSDARPNRHTTTEPQLHETDNLATRDSTETPIKKLVKTEDNQVRTQGISYRKEKQAVLVVTLTSIIFIVTNTPSIFLGFTRRFLPGFNLFQKYHDIFYLSYNLSNSLQFVNATINFFVYFKYNSKFRDSFSSRFGIVTSWET